MKQYIVNVLVFGQSVKKYVVAQIEIAETIADRFRDDETDVIIQEVTI